MRPIRLSLSMDLRAPSSSLAVILDKTLRLNPSATDIALLLYLRLHASCAEVIFVNFICTFIILYYAPRAFMMTFFPYHNLT